MGIEQNMFIEGILPQFVNRALGAEAMSEYRRPYLKCRTTRAVAGVAEAGADRK